MVAGPDDGWGAGRAQCGFICLVVCLSNKIGFALREAEN